MVVRSRASAPRSLSIEYWFNSKFVRRLNQYTHIMALMRNQIESAERIGVKAVSINSTNPGQYDRDETWHSEQLAGRHRDRPTRVSTPKVQ